MAANGYDGSKGDGRDKSPDDIHPNAQVYVAFASLYDVWAKPDCEALYTFTISTKDANEFRAHLHNRMPVILEQELEGAWLDQEVVSTQEVLDSLARSAGVQSMPILCPGWLISPGPRVSS